MNEFKILYLEHEPRPNVNGYIEAMEAARGARVVVIETVDRLSEALAKDWYDLVVTDSRFLPPGEDHLETGRMGEYRLREVIETVRRNCPNSNVRIVALTGYAPELFGEYQEDLDKVDDVWVKGTCESFIRWQVERMIQRTWVKFPGHTLVNALLHELHRRPADLPWAESMERMLRVYQRVRGERNQIEQVGVNIAEIVGTVTTKGDVRSLFDDLIGMEPFNVAAKTRAWGHLRHVINVFWLGYFILNCTNVRRTEIVRAVLESEISEDEAQNYRRVNLAWLLAAVFHDLGLMGERFQELFSKATELCERYGVGKFVRGTGRSKASHFECIGELKEGLDDLSKDAPRGEGAWLKGLSEKLDSIDHGVLSAVVLQGKLQGLGDSQVVRAAARAAAVHNCGNAARKFGIGLPAMRSDAAPITALLLLCDQLEVWDRETGQESRFEGLALEAAELSDLRYSADKGLEIDLAYRPFRYALSFDDQVSRIEEEVSRRLTGGVYGVLNCIDWKSPVFPSITVAPRVGVRPITPWRSLEGGRQA